MIEIDPKEVARYLSYRGQQPDETIRTLISECIQEVNETAEPKFICGRYPLYYSEAQGFQAASLQFKSGSLKRNLAGCREVFLFAATLGIAVDTLIRRSALMDAAKGLVMQAAAAAAIEAFCDSENDKLRDQVRSEGLFLRPRFSPGYGDLSLDVQRDFLRVLQAQKNIGLTLTDSGLMVPIKSVTALIGISDVSAPCHRQGCEACDKVDCAFRR